MPHNETTISTSPPVSGKKAAKAKREVHAREPPPPLPPRHHPAKHRPRVPLKAAIQRAKDARECVHLSRGVEVDEPPERDEEGEEKEEEEEGVVA